MSFVVRPSHVLSTARRRGSCRYSRSCVRLKIEDSRFGSWVVQQTYDDYWWTRLYAMWINGVMAFVVEGIFIIILYESYWLKLFAVFFLFSAGVTAGWVVCVVCPVSWQAHNWNQLPSPHITKNVKSCVRLIIQIYRYVCNQHNGMESVKLKKQYLFLKKYP
jgi:hypothetical protein